MKADHPKAESLFHAEQQYNGVEGRALVEAARTELAGTLTQIHELMLGR